MKKLALCGLACLVVAGCGEEPAQPIKVKRAIAEVEVMLGEEKP
jgi:hypothetical protein